MFRHIPVLLNEVVDGLNIKEDGVYVDCTLGGGGHAKEILKRLRGGILIGIDQDIDALNAAKENLKEFHNVIFEKNNFVNIKEILNKHNIKKVDGIYIDLGVSSYQFDTRSRGFSYNIDALLDMRMDKDNPLDCCTLVNTFDEKDIYYIIKNYGEDKFAKNIAKHICEYRQNKKIETTFELNDIIKMAIPYKIRKNDKHPSKRTFQSFRIYINDELNILEKTLDAAIDLLNFNGRLVVISFHSLEDKIVKDKFKYFANPCTCPKELPCVCGKKSKGIIINKKVIVPSEKEIKNNNRAHSAKLRIFERR